MPFRLPEAWTELLRDELSKPQFCELEQFVSAERQQHIVFPGESDVFRAFELTNPGQVRVVILGQDPYHDHDQAHGLAFSVRDGCRIPPSLRNIFKELAADIECPVPKVGDLSSWAEQGVFLLNTVLTVRAHQAHSHRKRGWEEFTDGVIRQLSASENPKVFLLWGKPAQTKQRLIQNEQHRVLMAPHPSPLSAHRGFFGSRPFSQINEILKEFGEPPIEWAALAEQETA